MIRIALFCKIIKGLICVWYVPLQIILQVMQVRVDQFVVHYFQGIERKIRAQLEDNSYRTRYFRMYGSSMAMNL